MRRYTSDATARALNCARPSLSSRGACLSIAPFELGACRTGQKKSKKINRIRHTNVINCPTRARNRRLWAMVLDTSTGFTEIINRAHFGVDRSKD